MDGRELIAFNNNRYCYFKYKDIYSTVNIDRRGKYIRIHVLFFQNRIFRGDAFSFFFFTLLFRTEITELNTNSFSPLSFMVLRFLSHRIEKRLYPPSSCLPDTFDRVSGSRVSFSDGRAGLSNSRDILTFYPNLNLYLLFPPLLYTIFFSSLSNIHIYIYTISQIRKAFHEE